MISETTLTGVIAALCTIFYLIDGGAFLRPLYFIQHNKFWLISFTLIATLAACERWH